MSGRWLNVTCWQGEFEHRSGPVSIPGRSNLPRAILGFVRVLASRRRMPPWNACSAYGTKFEPAWCCRRPQGSVRIRKQTAARVSPKDVHVVHDLHSCRRALSSAWAAPTVSTHTLRSAATMATVVPRRCISSARHSPRQSGTPVPSGASVGSGRPSSFHRRVSWSLVVASSDRGFSTRTLPIAERMWNRVEAACA